MKKLLLILLPVFALALACDEKEGGGKSAVSLDFSGSDAELQVPVEGDSFTIEFRAFKGEEPVEWEAYGTAPWVKVSPESGSGWGEITVTVEPNTTAGIRNAAVSIESGGKTLARPVTQSLNAGALQAESWFSKNFWERTDLEQTGLRGPVKSWYESTYTTYHKFFYDQAGHLVKEEYHNTVNNTVEVEWEHSYDSQGRRSRSEYSYGENHGSRTFTYEYASSGGKYVATDPYNFIPFIYSSGKSFPLTLIKDLAAIHYLDDSPAYYERTDYSYAFDSDGNLTITEVSQVGRETEPETYTYKVIYNGLYPSSFEKDGLVTSATFAANGMPLSYVEKSGVKSWSFYENDHLLLVKRLDEPNAGGMVAMFWADYKYNGNGDETEFKRAYFNKDQIYTDTIGKYFYDSHGNWIMRTEVREPAMQHGEFYPSIAERVITYWE
ncbi:MAG: BACON domain-containing protein [Bacteroidales bacterium]|nr:BACON domain-containing protein [Bacteroidales bacterium]